MPRPPHPANAAALPPSLRDALERTHRKVCITQSIQLAGFQTHIFDLSGLSACPAILSRHSLIKRRRKLSEGG
jgi:hypothetical protein